MAVVNPKAFIKLREKIKKAGGKIDDRATKRIADAVRVEMLKLIGRGSSPIKGNKRFPAYLGSKRKGKAKKRSYPYNTKEFKQGTKKARPVNLRLTGAFLSNLLSGGRRGIAFVGFRKNSLSAKKEQGHREGVKGQPSRPIIPNEDEEFAPIIQKVFRKLATEALRKAVKAALRKG